MFCRPLMQCTQMVTGCTVSAFGSRDPSVDDAGRASQIGVSARFRIKTYNWATFASFSQSPTCSRRGPCPTFKFICPPYYYSMDLSSHDSFHVAQFAQSLHKLQANQAAGHDDVHDDDASFRHPKTPLSRDEYGFRKSGIASPQLPSDPNNPMPVDLHNIVPDPNGLGWPGAPTFKQRSS